MYEMLVEFGPWGVVSGAFLIILRWMMNQFVSRLDHIALTNQEQSRNVSRLTITMLKMQEMFLVQQLTWIGLHPDEEPTSEQQRRVLEMIQRISKLIYEQREQIAEEMRTR